MTAINVDADGRFPRPPEPVPEHLDALGRLVRRSGADVGMAVDPDPAEVLPLVLLEAMAYGLPLVVTRWRSLPDLLPPDYPGLVDLRSPEQIAAVFEQWLRGEEGPSLRPWYEQHYQAERCLARMREVLTR